MLTESLDNLEAKVCLIYPKMKDCSDAEKLVFIMTNAYVAGIGNSIKTSLATLQEWRPKQILLNKLSSELEKILFFYFGGLC